ncbi:helix-turn-helix transcriptional regulator [Paraburkholderia sp. RAU2J]|uniref:helix-turn-helix transcriptional regulator n=1 Tax=Paraburkholderia sp. RAU2J TaxID=1938810 RepID=UPI0024114EFF|nr:helix-turn-helix transcriptional regulator [Paraburkholderia sp. RAU2J]
MAYCGTWTVDPARCRNDSVVPNLSSQRQNPTLVALGQAIRRLCEAKELSQEGLALLADVDRAYVGRVERGDNAADERSGSMKLAPSRPARRTTL